MHRGAEITHLSVHDLGAVVSHVFAVHLKSVVDSERVAGLHGPRAANCTFGQAGQAQKAHSDAFRREPSSHSKKRIANHSIRAEPAADELVWV